MALLIALFGLLVYLFFLATFVYAIGCDKTIARCADTFGNAHNFRGEPYLPGPARVVEFLTTGA